MGMNLLSKTIGDCFAERVRCSPDKIAISYWDIKYTWLELDQLSDYLAVRMVSYGLEKGDHVGIWSVNTPNWVLTFLALIKIGAIPVPINTCYLETELLGIIRYSDIKCIYYGDGYKRLNYEAMIQSIRGELDGQVKMWLPIGRDIEGNWLSDNSFHPSEKSLKAVKTLRNIQQRVSPHDAAIILFTSGTTSTPKGVVLSHYSLVNNAMETVIHMGWTSNDKMLIAVPLFHCFGITSGLLSSIHAGCTMHLVKYFKTQKVLEHIDRNGCTVLNGVPSMFLAMVHNPNYKDYRLSSLRSGIIAGSPISPQEYTLICNTISNIRLHQSYGQTETSPCVSIIDRDDSCDKKAFSTGKVIDYTKVRIVNIDTNEPVGVDQIGEIQVQGYNVMQGYYNLPLETEHAIMEGGWLRTGDLGYLDADGYLYITGRLKEMIIRGGENISPQEIENCLKECPDIQNVKVVGIPTKVLQEMIVACVIMEQGTLLKEDMIKAHLALKLAYYKIPAHILSFRAFPMNSSGKIQIPELKQQVIERLHQEQKEEDLLCFSPNNII